MSFAQPPFVEDEVFAFDELRKVMENHARQSAIAAGVGEVIQIEGYPFIQPKDALWVNFTYSIGDTFAAAAGQGDRDDGQHRSVGMVEINILYPENSGNGPATRVADRLRKHWTLKKWPVPSVGHVTIGGMGQKPLKLAPKGWRRILCEASLDFFHRG